MGKRALKRQSTKCWGSIKEHTSGQGQLERVRPGKALGEMLQRTFERRIRINLMKGEQAFKACKSYAKIRVEGRKQGSLPVTLNPNFSNQLKPLEAMGVLNQPLL